MIPNTVLTLGFLVLATVVTWYLVAALKQVKKTALAAELLMTGARPDIVAAASHLRSVLARTDGILVAIEESGVEARGLLQLMRQVLSSWRREREETTSRFVRMVSFFSNAALWIARFWPRSSEADMSAGRRSADGGGRS